MAKKPLFLDKDMLESPTKTPLAPPPSVKSAPEPKPPGRPLNFRVPEEFDDQFRMTALKRRLKLTELLMKSFEVYLREEGETPR